MKLKKFLCQFPNPWALRVSGMVGYTSKCEKKSKSLHPSAQQISLYNVVCKTRCMARKPQKEVKIPASNIGKPKDFRIYRRKYIEFITNQKNVDDIF